MTSLDIACHSKSSPSQSSSAAKTCDIKWHCGVALPSWSDLWFNSKNSHVKPLVRHWPADPWCQFEQQWLLDHLHLAKRKCQSTKKCFVKAEIFWLNAKSSEPLVSLTKSFNFTRRLLVGSRWGHICGRQDIFNTMCCCKRLQVLVPYNPFAVISKLFVTVWHLAWYPLKILRQRLFLVVTQQYALVALQLGWQSCLWYARKSKNWRTINQ